MEAKLFKVKVVARKHRREAMNLKYPFELVRDDSLTDNKLTVIKVMRGAEPIEVTMNQGQLAAAKGNPFLHVMVVDPASVLITDEPKADLSGKPSTEEAPSAHQAVEDGPGRSAQETGA